MEGYYVNINNAIQGLSREILSRDPSANIRTIAADTKKPVRFNIQLPPMSQHLADLRVEMSDKKDHPYTYWYAILHSPFGGVTNVRYYPTGGKQ